MYGGYLPNVYIHIHSYRWYCVYYTHEHNTQQYQPFKMYLPKTEQKTHSHKSINKMRNKLVERAKIMVIFNITTFFPPCRIFMRCGRNNEIFSAYDFTDVRNKNFNQHRGFSLSLILSLPLLPLCTGIPNYTKIHRYVMDWSSKKYVQWNKVCVCAYVRWFHFEQFQQQKNVDFCGQ